MKIKKLIIMIVLLLACVGVSKGQADTYSLYIALGDEKVDPRVGYEIVFGEQFCEKYNVTLSKSFGGYVTDLSDLVVSLKNTDDNSVLSEEFNLYGNCKIPKGTYYIIIKYKGKKVSGFDSFYNETKLTVHPRPIKLVSDNLFHCYSNGTMLFDLSDFCESNNDNVTKNQFVEGCRIVGVEGQDFSGLASFDNTTVVDWSATKMRFRNSSQQSSNPQDYDFEWGVTSNGDGTDWSSNYTLVESSGSGYIHAKCPYSINWVLDGSTKQVVADEVNIPYGTLLGYDYGLYPVIGGTEMNESLPEFGENAKSPEFKYGINSYYTAGSVLNVGKYDFTVVFKALDGIDR